MFVRRILSVAVAVGVFATFAPVVMAQKDAPKMAGGKMESKGDKKSPPRDAKGRFMKKGGPAGDHRMAGGKMERGDKKSPPRDAKGRFMKKGGPAGDHRMAGGKMESKGDKKSPPRDAKGRFMKKQ